MNAVDVFKRLYQHRAWVNDNLLTAAAQLRPEQLRAPFQIGQGSLWKSLVHMYAAEYVWLEVLLGNETGLAPGDLPGRFPGNQEGEGGITSLEDLRDRWSALERRWTAYLDSLTPDVLEDIVYRVSSAMGKRFGNRRGDVLLHVCTHAHYTAAQTVNMLRHSGVENLPQTMLIALARQEAL
jgi:uncharacterized damage-inducible protein DinB